MHVQTFLFAFTIFVAFGVVLSLALSSMADSARNN
jgi:hypothetical protein